ncbi:MAG: M3 family oligoendopeptidase [Alicyclobacillus macrosporangiidus]|uniref:M3 family oligoendopeptidase n=1 Tax=Alicyclobacillus macrosporangiidus TaxID=392015 RepID=UPI0026EA852B|nr:M3 family oligoendopeptidase [Alicyclobacillus macrosporangiidus]MCL6598675.1 M3 family oligoendopeptidase [Alicyclobacillus macrosporangiidus]
MHVTTVLQQTWDLDSLFPGGSRSAEFSAFLDDLARAIDSFTDRTTRLPVSGGVDDWAESILALQDLRARQRQAAAFTECLTSADTRDERAKGLQSRVTELSGRISAALAAFDAKLSQLDEATWAQLIEDYRVVPVRFHVEERRRRALDKLPPEQEQLIAGLMVDGYHGWSQLYDTIVGGLTITVEDAGTRQTISMGQAANRLLTPDRAVRDRLFQQWEAAWQSREDLCAQAINHIAGFRLEVYRRRGWDDVLREPLEINRMDRETLETMWAVIAANKAPLVKYLERKAKLFGVPRLSWHDVPAPLGRSTSTVTYEQARQFIVDHFGQFNPEMARFADSCFRDRWIEAEDRPGKQSGAFCTSFPVSRQTRVFMTFSGTTANVSTLAHELGHAYHQHVMRDMPVLMQQYAMNVAETASTFAEAIVSDAAVRAAGDKDERIALLDEKIERAVAMLMNIHARFLFETRFYEERKRGWVPAERLNELMVEAQREAYCDALAEWHPRFWASKLHFYITTTPFYNFPYTFGYLFSAGIYARAQAEGPSFADKYVALLRDTAAMRVEELAHRHLGVDLRQPDFWQSAVDLAVADVDEFLRLTE